MFVFLSCSKKKKEYYDNGFLAKEYVLKEGNLNGEYKEFYDNGNLHFIHSYKAGKKIDSSLYFFRDTTKLKFKRYWYLDKQTEEIVFHRNGKIKSKGLISDNFLREGKWEFYDLNGKLKSIKEYKIINKEQYLNQSWYLNQKGDTLSNNGNFYDIRITNDTIVVGEPLKAAFYLDVPLFKGKDSHVLLCIPSRDNVNFEKDFSNDGKIKLDTFYNLTKDIKNQKWFAGADFKKTIAFGKYYNTLGSKNLRGYILEYYNQAPSEKDSIVREERKIYFDIPIYVKDSSKNNVPNKKEI